MFFCFEEFPLEMCCSQHSQYHAYTLIDIMMNDVDSEEASRLMAILMWLKHKMIFIKWRRTEKKRKKNTNIGGRARCEYISLIHAAIILHFENWHIKHTNRARFIAVVVDAVAAAAAAVCRYFAVFGRHIGYYMFDSRSNIHNMCTKIYGLNLTDLFHY